MRLVALMSLERFINKRHVACNLTFSKFIALRSAAKKYLMVHGGYIIQTLAFSKALMSKGRVIFKRLLPSKTLIQSFIFKKPVRFFNVRSLCKAKSPKNNLSLGIKAGRALRALRSHRRRRVVVQHRSRRKSKSH